MDINFIENEHKILRWWQENKIFEKSIKARPTSRQFVFYEGPPTANGKPGLHHVLARIFKDIICRYKTMQGFRVQRKAGWDTHGLPVELEVEKDLGLKNKKEIEQYGIAQFNKKCKESVWKYKELWEGLTERIGYWLDMEHPYITYASEYIETVWWLIKQIWQKGLLYQDYKVVPYCPRCGTSLSSHEVAQGYKKVKEPAIFVKFQIANSKLQAPSSKLHLLVWTTTPWTLPGNVALAVGADISYSLVKKLDLETNQRESLIFADAFCDKFHNLGHAVVDDLDNIDDKQISEAKKRGYHPYETVVANFKGSDLLGLEYEQIFDIPELKNENSHRVYAADFVTDKEGTGIVHTAVMYGVDDYELGKKHNLPQKHTVDKEGRFNNLVKCFAEQPVKAKETEKNLIDYLKKKNLFFQEELYEHDYPFCWRCKEPLLYYASQTWFIEMSKVKNQLLKNNQKINWVPEHIKDGRFGEWLREVKDWALARERYWGTPLPIWQCQINEYQSNECQNNDSQPQKNSKTLLLCSSRVLAETKIKDKAIGCKNIVVIGSIKELKELSGKKMNDLHRPEIDKVTFRCDKCGGQMKRVPEVIDCWFDSGAMPFAQGQWPWAQVQSSKFKIQSYKKLKPPELFPADYICEAIDQTRGWFYTLLAISTLLGYGPAYKNVISLGHILDEKGEKMSKSRGNVIDPWLVINKYGADSVRWFFFTNNQPGDSKQVGFQHIETTLKRFIMTLWNCYAFFGTYVPKKQVSGFRFQVSGNILDKWIISKLNELIQIVTEKLDKYDITAAARAIEDFVIDDLSLWYIRRSRRRFQNPTNQKELKEATQTLGFVLLAVSRLTAPFIPFLSEEVYQKLPTTPEGKQASYGAGNYQLPTSVHLEDWPKADKKLIDQLLEQKMARVRELVSLALAERAKAGIKVRQPLGRFKIQDLRFKADKELLELIKGEVNVKEIIFDSKLKKEVELDTKITPELKEEGIIREILRHIQELRKEAGLQPKDKILVRHSGSPELQGLLEKHKRFFLDEGKIKDFDELQAKSKRSFDLTKEIKVGDEKLWLAIRLVS